MKIYETYIEEENLSLMKETEDGEILVALQGGESAGSGDHYANSGWTALAYKKGDKILRTFVGDETCGDFLGIIPAEGIGELSGRQRPAFVG